MQFKEALKLYGNEVAVIAPWAYVPKSNKNMAGVREKDVDKVKFVDTNAYEFRRSWFEKDSNGNWPDVFQPAFESTRTKSFLFENDKGQRYTLKASEVIGLWSDVEPEFARLRTAQEQAENERTRQERIRSSEHDKIANSLAPLQASIVESVKSLVGYEGTGIAIVNADSLRVTGDWDDDTARTAYRARIGGFVQIEVGVLQQLLEDFFEAREALAELREEVHA